MSSTKAHNAVAVAVRNGSLPHISTQKCNIKRGKAKVAQNQNCITSFQLPASLKKKAEARARKEGLSFSSWNRILIRRELDNG